MLWMSVCEVVCVSLLGGVFGGGLMALAHKQSNRFNMRMLEDSWNSDIKYFRCRMEALDQKISTLSVDKPVGKHVNKYQSKGCKEPRHFNQRG